MTHAFFSRVFAPVLTCALSTAASADDAALYDKAAPADAAFVRFLGFEGGTTVEFAGQDFRVPQDQMDAYFAVSAANLVDVAAGSFVSVTRDGDHALRRIDEPPRDNRAKVHLVLVNDSDSPVKLATTDGKMSVIDTVAPGMSASRAVNPVSASLGLFDADGTRVDSFDVTLRRGQNLSFVVRNEGARLVRNSFGPVLD